MLKSLFKDTVIYGLADFTFKFISFATFPIFAHALSVAEFGMYSLLVTMSILVGVVVMCGFNNAVQRLCLDPSTSLEARQKIISTGLWSIFLNACMAGCALFSLGFFFQHPEYQITVPMVGWSVLCGIAMQIDTFCSDIVRIEFRPWKYTLLNFIQNALLVALSLYFVIYLRQGVSGYIKATALAYLFLMPICLWTIRRNIILYFNYAIAKKMMHFGYPFIFAGFGYWIFNSMDRWMLTELSTYEEVGLYSIAFKIASVLIFINFAFGQAWNPFALQNFHTNPSYRTSYSRLMSLWFFALITISLFISVCGYEFLMLVSPPEYWPAANLLPFICLSLALYGTTPILAMGITLENKTHHYSFAVGIAVISNFLLNWLLIPSHGAQGAAFATLCSNFILWTYYLCCSHWLHPIPLETKRLMFCLGTASIGVLFNLWINVFEWNYEIAIYKMIFLIILVGSLGGSISGRKLFRTALRHGWT